MGVTSEKDLGIIFDEKLIFRDHISKKAAIANRNLGLIFRSFTYIDKVMFLKGEFQICPRMDFDNILYVEYLRYNNYKNEIILFLEGC